CDVAESPAATARAPRGQYDFVDTVVAGQSLVHSPRHDARTIARAADRAEDVVYVRSLHASEHRMMTFEDDDEDPEEDLSEEHEPEDDDEDPEEDPNEEHEPENEDTKDEEPSEDSDKTESFEDDETAVTPPPPKHRRARISVRPQTPMATST
nr:hypothetical protein [Tanacetum cinerariifolium]